MILKQPLEWWSNSAGGHRGQRLRRRPLGQAGAHPARISRALTKLNPEFRPP